MRYLSFLFLFLLIACSDTDILETDEIRVEGVLDLRLDGSFVIGGLLPKIEDLKMEVEDGKILFSSERYSFNARSSFLYGNTDTECHEYDYTANRTYTEDNIHYLLFTPGDDFWECIEYMQSCLKDELIVFVLYVVND